MCKKDSDTLLETIRNCVKNNEPLPSLENSELDYDSHYDYESIGEEYGNFKE